MRALTAALCAAVFASSAFAAFEPKARGAQAQALGAGLSAHLDSDAWAATQNPATLAGVASPQISSFYTQRYALSELTDQGAVLAYPTRWGNFSAAAVQFGDGIYGEKEFIWSQNFPPIWIDTSAVVLGYAAHGYFLSIDGYGAASAYGLDFGIFSRINSFLRAGFVAKNLNRPSIGASAEPLPQSASFGLEAEPFEWLTILTEFAREKPSRNAYHAGLAVAPAEVFALRLGFNAEPWQFSGGFGLRKKHWKLDYAYLNHPELEAQHQLTLTFLWDSQKRSQLAEKKSAPVRPPDPLPKPNPRNFIR